MSSQRRGANGGGIAICIFGNNKKKADGPAEPHTCNQK
jgi:hypothetical protein